jgi:hypothetical protein
MDANTTQRPRQQVSHGRMRHPAVFIRVSSASMVALDAYMVGAELEKKSVEDMEINIIGRFRLVPVARLSLQTLIKRHAQIQGRLGAPTREMPTIISTMSS